MTHHEINLIENAGRTAMAWPSEPEIETVPSYRQLALPAMCAALIVGGLLLFLI